MISAVAEMYEIHPQTLRLYEREGLLKPSRTEGNTRLYTDEDLERLELFSIWRASWGSTSRASRSFSKCGSGWRRNRQMQSFVDYVRTEMLSRMQQGYPAGGVAIVPLRKPVVMPDPQRERNKRCSGNPLSTRPHAPDPHFRSRLFGQREVRRLVENSVHFRIRSNLER